MVLTFGTKSSDTNSGNKFGRGYGRPDLQTLKAAPQDLKFGSLGGSSRGFFLWTVYLGWPRHGRVATWVHGRFLLCGVLPGSQELGVFVGEGKNAHFPLSGHAQRGIPETGSE